MTIVRYGQNTMIGYWSLGRALQLCYELEQSVDVLDAAVSLNPSSVMSLYSLGRSQIWLSDAELCLQLMTQARQISPNDPMSFALISVQATSLLNMQHYYESVRLADVAMQRAPNPHFHLLALTAVTHKVAGRDESADDYFAQVCQVKPDYTDDDFLWTFPFQQDNDTANKQLVT